MSMALVDKLCKELLVPALPDSLKRVMDELRSRGLTGQEILVQIKHVFLTRRDRASSRTGDLTLCACAYYLGEETIP
jgi:hypothetical protein